MASSQFPAWFRDQLKRREWTYADFARKSGVGPSMVSFWARGERVPSPQSCDIIADVLLVDVDEVLSLAGHRPPIASDDPPEIADLFAMIRKTEMHPDRIAGLRSMLNAWQAWDNREAQSSSGSSS